LRRIDMLALTLSLLASLPLPRWQAELASWRQDREELTAVEAECRRFPPDLTDDQQRFAEQLDGYWLHCQRWNDRNYWMYAAARRDLAECQRAWALLAHARWTERDVCGRRECLEELRGLIGDAAYGAGRMPPPVPLWRFREVP
jgi:hypothetical protein